jgi:hypothetical protein
MSKPAARNEMQSKFYNCGSIFLFIHNETNPTKAAKPITNNEFT